MELRVILRANLRWSDGKSLTACQYKDGILRALDPKAPAALADILFDIQNAPVRKAGKLEASKVRILCDEITKLSACNRRDGYGFEVKN
jgi:ABC-type oligopeptide transport system substrate-binding subunit